VLSPKKGIREYSKSTDFIPGMDIPWKQFASNYPFFFTGGECNFLKIDGISHEFSTMDGIKEDVIVMILNIKKIRFKIASDEPQTVTLSSKVRKRFSQKISRLRQVEILNPDLYLVEVTGKVI